MQGAWRRPILTIRNAGRRLGRGLTPTAAAPAPRLQARETGRLNLSHLGAAGLEDALSAALASGLRGVTELDVSSNGLEALPPGIAACPGLRVLRAKYNRMPRLPLEALAQLPRLEQLDLESNQITAVEEEALPQLASLKSLCLSSNGLLTLPASISTCSRLEVLAASNNPLTQLPDSLGACAALTHLDVSSCHLAALPASLARSRLQRLFCQNNDLPKVPTALGHLSGTLKEWNCRANRLPLKYEQVGGWAGGLVGGWVGAAEPGQGRHHGSTSAVQGAAERLPGAAQGGGVGGSTRQRPRQRTVQLCNCASGCPAYRPVSGGWPSFLLSCVRRRRLRHWKR